MFNATQDKREDGIEFYDYMRVTSRRIAGSS
jgi:hypothetical protein